MAYLVEGLDQIPDPKASSKWKPRAAPEPVDCARGKVEREC